MNSVYWDREVGYIATIQWMSYNEECVPFSLYFAATYAGDKDYAVVAQKESLTSFTYNDVVKMLKAREQLIYDLKPILPDDCRKIPITQMKQYLKTEFCNDAFSRLNSEVNGRDSKVAAVDMSVFKYLKPLLPKGRVLYCGDYLDFDWPQKQASDYKDYFRYCLNPSLQST